MLIKIASAKCVGIEALPVIVEVNVANGIGIHLVGLADVAVKESLLRTVTALQAIGLRVPGKKIVINLAPADIHKKGSGYDLPIALGIIAASQQMEMKDLDKYVITGELGLDGTVRYVPGALPISEMANRDGYKACILPYDSAIETACFDTGTVYGVHTLKDVLAILCQREGCDSLIMREGSVAVTSDSGENAGWQAMDFSEIVGQEVAKRGLEIAASGGHNAIMVGPPGSGKSSLAKALCGIMPPMSSEEALQTCKIYSVAGRGLPSHVNSFTRPFRAPHTTTSVPALVGGGSDCITPGEISLAHNGILFLDEFCEMPKKTMEVLRGPLEEHRIILSRLRTKVEYPANFTLIAATNPCPCGYFGEGDRCTCSVGQRKSYLAKLSGPLMDRIDIQLWLHSVDTKKLMNTAEKEESSSTVSARVMRTREIQRKRFRNDGIFCNAQMNNRLMKKYCPLDSQCREFLDRICERMGLSARACMKIVKLSRTIADMDLSDDIRIEHLSEAVSYRFLDRSDV
ncbi:MAG: YifB family Mg chelatase-like AAA ATPase [Bacteroidales bacterium]|nr:YifB family Mg chelatase-like AAA ATPase [Bacteroidales bacterium]